MVNFKKIPEYILIEDVGPGSYTSNLRIALGFLIVNILKQKEMNQKEISDIIKIQQPEVSHLVNEHFDRFSTEKLLEFLKHLNQKVSIGVIDRKNTKYEPFLRINGCIVIR